MIKKAFLLFAGILCAGNIQAKTYDGPYVDKVTTQAFVGISGQTEYGTSTSVVAGPRTVYTTISGTGGVVTSFGVSATTVTASTVTAPIVNVSTLNINGVQYTWPNADGGTNHVLTTNGNRQISWSPTAAATLSKPYRIYLGTTSTWGADVIATTTEGFDFAISSAGGQISGTSVTVYVQPGMYYYSGRMSSVPANVTLEFDKGAWVVWDQTKKWNPVFGVSGTIIAPNMDISTSIISAGANGSALFQMWENGRILGGEAKIRLNEVGNYSVFSYVLFELGTRAKNAFIDNFFVSSYTIQSNVNSGERTSLIHVAGATNTIVSNLRIEAGQRGVYTTNRNLITLDAADGVHFFGGYIRTAERLLSTEQATNGMIRGFRMSDMRFVLTASGADANGTVFIQDPASVYFSSGNALANIDVQYKYTSSNKFLTTNATIPGGWVINGLRIYHDSASTGGGFTIAAGATKIILMNNVIEGTSDCMTDGGSNTKWTGNDNFCQGNEQ